MTSGRILKRAPPPLIIGATGGSGTRLVARIAELAGRFMGAEVSQQFDSLPMGELIRAWIPVWLDAGAEGLTGPRRAQMDQELRIAATRHRVGIPSPTAPWGSKNPRNIYLVRYFEQQMPGFRFLHVVRNGLDMAFSNNQLQLAAYGDQLLPGDRRSEEEKSIAIWNWVNVEASDFGAERLDDRYLRIRFEDLCAEPDRVVPQIFDFLGAEDAAGLAAAVAEVRPPSTIGRSNGRDPELLKRLRGVAAVGLERFGYLEPPPRQRLRQGTGAS